MLSKSQPNCVELIYIFGVQITIYIVSVGAKARLSRSFSEPLKTRVFSTRLISHTNIAYYIISVEKNISMPTKTAL